MNILYGTADFWSLFSVKIEIEMVEYLRLFDVVSKLLLKSVSILNQKN